MSFPLISNETLCEKVLSQIENDRLPHAVIIEGEKGLGRHIFAKFLSLAVLCSENRKPCYKCQSCHLGEVGSHPDITVVAPEDKKKNIAVGQIRELRQSAFVKPHFSNRRVFIIDKAETMNLQSQNTLLKILEEPPYGVYFILITESAKALLETVLSRCVIFKLSTPTKSEGFNWINDNIKPKRDAELIKRALDESKGNIGRAVELLRKRNADSPEAIAKEFSKLLFSGDEYSMLLMLSNFEKDRPKADVFLASFKYEIASLLRENYNDIQKSKLLSDLYSLCDGFALSLKSNINLSLLFCEITATVKKLRKEYNI